MTELRTLPPDLINGLRGPPAEAAPRMIEAQCRAVRGVAGGGIRAPEVAPVDVFRGRGGQSALSSRSENGSSGRVRIGSDWKSAYRCGSLAGGRPSGECRMINPNRGSAEGISCPVA